MTDTPRPKLPSITDIPSEIFPDDKTNTALFRSAQAQARAILAHGEAHRDTAHELNKLNRMLAPVADMLLRESQKKAVGKHWAAIFAVLLPFVSIVFSVFFSWYFAHKAGP